MKKLCKDKTILRKQMLSKLDKQKEEIRLKKSNSILRKFFALPRVKKAKHIMFFVSMADEVNTFGMIEKSINEGKQVSIPTVEKKGRQASNHMRSCEFIGIRDHLVVGPLGVLHPKKRKYCDPGKIDVVVIPALAFDRQGNRLGRGAGYYDRFLSGIPGNIYKIGLAFSFQVLEQLPSQPHDIKVDKIIAA